jgi:hypothetical protein
MPKYDPGELALIRDVYEAVVAEAWFNRNSVTERELLKLVLEKYDQGWPEAEVFRRYCLDAAKARFFKSR